MRAIKGMTDGIVNWFLYTVLSTRQNKLRQKMKCLSYLPEMTNDMDDTIMLQRHAIPKKRKSFTHFLARLV